MTLSPFDRLADRAAVWLRAGQVVLDTQRSRFSHVIVRSADGVGFALFGGFKARHRMAAAYCPAGDVQHTRVVLHRPATTALCRALAARWGMVAFCGESAPPGLEGEVLSIPVDVDMEIMTPQMFDGPGAEWTRSAKANIARVKRGGFSSDVIVGGDWIGEFHRRMHGRAMRTQHGPKAYVVARRAIQHFAGLEGSELLRIFKGEHWLAGSLNRSTPEGYRLWIMGWRDGDAALRKQGVLSATYWFNLQRAAALGHRRILLGSVEPYLGNGIFRYKELWGATLSPPTRRTRLDLLLDPSHQACARFLRAHSIVTWGADGRYIVFSGKPPEAVSVSPAISSQIARWYVWRETRSAAPDVRSDDVPRALRPWVSCARG